MTPTARPRIIIPHVRIRRIVGDMPARYTEADVRADIRRRCDYATWTAELIQQAEDYAWRVFAGLKGIAE